jgi:hypothetical protein
MRCSLHGLYLQLLLKFYLGRRGLYLLLTVRHTSVVHDWWKQCPILQCPSQKKRCTVESGPLVPSAKRSHEQKSERFACRP